MHRGNLVRKLEAKSVVMSPGWLRCSTLRGTKTLNYALARALSFSPNTGQWRDTASPTFGPASSEAWFGAQNVRNAVHDLVL
jgi:hypothetical protein